MAGDITFTFSFDQADQAIQDMKNAASSIQGKLQDLNSTLSTHLSEWNSQARDAYNYAQQVWNSAAQDMVTNLGIAGVTLSHISEGYHQAELTNTNRWK